MTALLYLKQYNDQLNGSSEALERAAYLYRKFIEKRKLKGRSIQAIAIATLYLAYRQLTIPYNLKDVAKVSNFDRKEIATCYRILLSTLNIKPKPLQLNKLVSRLANVINLKETTKRLALDLCYKVMEKEKFIGKDPLGIAVAVLYIAAYINNEHVTQATLSNKFNITQVTIRNRYKRILNLLDIHLN
jgi:transcription initiation factor TFIIB